MKDKSPNQFNPLKELTPELMDGYVNGTLTPEVMEQVEQFLSENPFEAEAIEGLRSQPVNLSEDLTELDRRLTKSLRPEPQHRIRWWQLAAAIALLAISGIVFYLVAPWDQNNEPIAVNQQVQDDSLQEYLEIPEEEIITQDDGDPVEDVVIEEKTEDIPNEPDTRKPGNLENESAIEPTTPRKVEVEVDSRQNKASQRPIKFDLDNSPSSTDIQNPEAQPSSADAGSSLEEQEKLLSNELVAPRALSNSSAARKKNATPISQLPVANPPSGWDNYIAKELNIPDSALAKGVSGVVEITFQVGADGIPFDFGVSKSLGFGCDEEAIRLVQEGPRWKPAIIGSNPVISIGKVEIKFP